MDGSLKNIQLNLIKYRDANAAAPSEFGLNLGMIYRGAKHVAGNSIQFSCEIPNLTSVKPWVLKI